MDIHLLRSLFTVLLFAIFVGIVLWAWSGRNRPRFDEAALLPFADEHATAAPAAARKDTP
ncbi:MAG: cbb3-type cytochrome c oxidase subunit 3 [Ottowia sp.]|nr:cbb3-type cytochrome c oxidase subunit 3 [Ottowia sp.]